MAHMQEDPAAVHLAQELAHTSALLQAAYARMAWLEAALVNPAISCDTQPSTEGFS